MIRPDQIPDEVLKAAMLTDERLGMRTVIAAALNAWPGATDDYGKYGDGTPVLILPLPPQETDNG